MNPDNQANSPLGPQPDAVPPVAPAQPVNPVEQSSGPPPGLQPAAGPVQTPGDPYLGQHPPQAPVAPEPPASPVTPAPGPLPMPPQPAPQPAADPNSQQFAPPAPNMVPPPPGAPVQPLPPLQPGAAAPAISQQPTPLAIAALITSVLVTPVGLVLSILVLRKSPNKDSKIMAIIGLVISGLSILALVGFLLLIAMAEPALKTNAENTRVRTNLMVVQSYLESSFATTSTYPSLTELNDGAWRSVNMKGIQPAAMSPNGTVLQLTGGAPTNDQFSYKTTPSDCAGNKTDPCTSYELDAKLSDGKLFTLKSVN